MKARHRIHHKMRHVERIPMRLLVVLLITSSLITFFALRSNNLKMVELREDVYKADKAGGNVSKALNNLRAHVYAHMNSNLSAGANAIKPPIQLKYTYERLVKTEEQRVSAANSQIYTEAQAICQRKYPDSFSGGPRVPCITDYVTKHGEKAKEIPAALYQFDFVSPGWSPDLAGWGLLLTVVLALTLIAKIAHAKLQTHD